MLKSNDEYECSSSNTASSTISLAAVTTKSKLDTSGLTPIEVALTLAVLFGVFILLIIVGELCKLFNKPRAEATPYSNNQQKKLFQPSAAGYGTRIAGLQVPQGKTQYSSRASLLGGASPMGRGGMQEGDTSMSTPGSSKSGGNDYFGKVGHNRGQSSGIKLPGATAATSRKGAPAHPYMQGTSVAPDGSGFQVRQAVNHNNSGPGPSGYASRPSGSSPTSQRMHNAMNSSVGVGPPPATDASRRSRYIRQDGRRIDSVGPGQIRKSMYLGNEGGNAQEGGPRLPSNSNSNLRRIDSVGRGDHRRKSTYTSDPTRGGRGASIYNNAAAGNENYGSGRENDPLGVKNNTQFTAMNQQSQSNVSQSYQQQKDLQQTGMNGLQRQVSPSGMPLSVTSNGLTRQVSPNGMPRQVSPNGMPMTNGGALQNRPMQPARGFSGYTGGGGPYGMNGGMQTRQVV